MKAVVLNGQSIECVELPLSPLPKQWARIRVESVGLCGTDVAKLTGNNLPASHTRVLGHEFIGQVLEVNESSSKISVGDWVICMPLIACGNCDACVRYKENLCVNTEAIGRTAQGAFAESVDVPLKNLTKVSVLHESYVLADPLAVCLHAANLVTMSSSGSASLVIGDGAIGCLLAWFLLKQGHQVSIKGIHPKNLQLIEGFGAHVLNADVQPKSYDEVYETVGRSKPQTLEESLKAVKAGGNVVVLGVYAPGYIYPLVARELFIKEALVQGANAYTRAEFEETITLIGRHKDELAAFLSHTFPLFQFLDALEAARNKKGLTMKIVLKPGGSS
jgi:threonine dehydrogenase-like Zn-dependent dehydrogenase